MNGSGGRRVPRLAAAMLAASLALAAPARGATGWVTDPAHSRLTFVASGSAGEFEGRFDRFHADIAFDPRDLAGSRFQVTIETGSADTQDGERDKALAGDDFFAVGRWPTANYEATRFVAMASGRYEARGRLTIRGVSRDVNVMFSFKPPSAGHGAILSGGTTIHRLDFGVGQGEWHDTTWVADDVRIQFELLLESRPAVTSDNRASNRPRPALLKPDAA